MISNKNPFVGLRPFEANESLYYFGRSEQTAELLTYLHKTHMVAVVGSSGCGKSSLVRAGLIPHLQAGFLVQDRDSWHIARLKPGDRPIYHLADALLSAFGEKKTDRDTIALVNELEMQGIRALLKRFTPILEAKGSNLFILVDQFEEVFRYGLKSQDSAGREEAAEFVDLLLKLARQKEAPVYVCLTMRSDYMGDCDAFFGLPEALNRSQYLVPRLTRMQRRQVIEGPIRIAGGAIESRLVDRLLNDSGEYRDDLPLLQHALMRTWDHWQKQGNDSAALDLVHYEAIHTMKQALSMHVNEALEELDGEEQLLAKTLFQLLTETDAENRQIRRPVHLDDIVAVTEASKDRLMDIIDKFRRPDRAFLVLSAATPANNPLVDISHESLMRQWETLKTWMEDEKKWAKIYKRLADAATLKGNIYIDPALQEALNWREEKKPNKAWADRYHEGFDNAMAFLEESRVARDEKIREGERQREERERLLKEKAHQQQKALHLTRWVAAIIAAALIIAAGLAYLAVRGEKEAKRRTLESNYNLARLFDEKAVKALESGKNTKDAKDFKDAWLNMMAALRQKIDKDKLPLQPKSAGALLSPDVVNAAFQERWVSTLSNNDTSNGSAEQDSVSLRASPSANNNISTLNAVAFSPDGKIIAAAVDNNIRLMERNSKKEIAILQGHSERVTSMAFSVDGKIIVTGSVEKTIRLWDMESQGEIAMLPGHTETVLSVAISPDSKTIASGSEDNTIRLWDIETKKEIATLTGHTDRVTVVAFSADGKTIVSGSWDET
ncbi:MAG: WD40 repeat domain-containing protein, partial [Acidobacteria bacterium]|nr:WD40 repeat domain-containing protein [Acidobacteriota bacterium]